MGESLMMQRRVRDEGFRIVNLCRQGAKSKYLFLFLEWFCIELTWKGSSG
jgi:hypothetical protein